MGVYSYLKFLRFKRIENWNVSHLLGILERRQRELGRTRDRREDRRAVGAARAGEREDDARGRPPHQAPRRRPAG